MELGFDHQTLARALDAEPQTGAALDWAGLRARFVAVHALRRALGNGHAESPGGSFIAAGSHVLAVNREVFAPVNPNASANRKATLGIELEVAAIAGQGTED